MESDPGSSQRREGGSTRKAAKCGATRGKWAGGKETGRKIQEFESKWRSLGRRDDVPASFASAGFRLNSQLGIKAIRQQQNKVLLQF